MQLRGLTIRLYPTKEQEVLMNKTFGCCRQIYNLHLNERNEYWKKYQEVPKEERPVLKPTTEKEWKEKFEYMKEVSSTALQQARKDCDKIIEYVKQYEAETVVCGLPLMLNGTDSPQTEKVREFAKLLENKMRSSALKTKLEFMDERFTTKMAEDVMMQTGMKRKERKEYVDKQAAMIILQSYMDKLRFAKENL